MFHKSDPRSVLIDSSGVVRPPESGWREAEVGQFANTEPEEITEGRESWYLRGRNMILMLSRLRAGAVIERAIQHDEYIAFTLAPELGLSITANGESGDFDGNSLTIVPPGPSRILAKGEGLLACLFSPRCTDLAALCSNRAAFQEADPLIPAYQAWPDPVAGYRLRNYSLDVPKTEGRFGRIFRCTTFMVNILDPREGHRDPTKLSPHHHNDFEQMSLALRGSFTHLLRWPWTPNRGHWREDAAISCPAPSACVIPPPVIHTSVSTDPGINQLIDIFSPPRVDFSLRAGWVLNADDYPLPSHMEALK